MAAALILACPGYQNYDPYQAEDTRANEKVWLRAVAQDFDELQRFFEECAVRVDTRSVNDAYLTVQQALERINAFFAGSNSFFILVGLSHGDRRTEGWQMHEGVLHFGLILHLWRFTSSRNPDRRLFILTDCCFSGRWTNRSATLGLQNISVQSSCSLERTAFDIRGGTFTHHWVRWQKKQMGVFPWLSIKKPQAYVPKDSKLWKAGNHVIRVVGYPTTLTAEIEDVAATEAYVEEALFDHANVISTGHTAPLLKPYSLQSRVAKASNKEVAVYLFLVSFVFVSLFSLVCFLAAYSARDNRAMTNSILHCPKSSCFCTEFNPATNPIPWHTYWQSPAHMCTVQLRSYKLHIPDQRLPVLISSLIIGVCFLRKAIPLQSKNRSTGLMVHITTISIVRAAQVLGIFMFFGDSGVVLATSSCLYTIGNLCLMSALFYIIILVGRWKYSQAMHGITIGAIVGIIFAYSIAWIWWGSQNIWVDVVHAHELGFYFIYGVMAVFFAFILHGMTIPGSSIAPCTLCLLRLHMFWVTSMLMWWLIGKLNRNLLSSSSLLFAIHFRSLELIKLDILHRLQTQQQLW